MNPGDANALGDNRPPPDADPMLERFVDQYAELITRAEALCEAEARVPETITGETAGRLTDYVRQIKACVRTAEEQRKAEKEPYLAVCRKVDTWFGSVTRPLTELAKRVDAKLADYLKAKAEAARKAGATAKIADIVREHTGMGGVLSAKEPLTFTITDPKAAAASLWAEISAEELEKAARTYARKHGNELRAQLQLKRQPLQGVRFSVELEVVIR
jgi:hypothetical protein